MCFSSDYPSSARIRTGLRMRPCVTEMNRATLPAAESRAEPWLVLQGPCRAPGAPQLLDPAGAAGSCVSISDAGSNNVPISSPFLPSLRGAAAAVALPGCVPAVWEQGGVKPGIILSRGRK